MTATAGSGIYLTAVQESCALLIIGGICAYILQSYGRVCYQFIEVFSQHRFGEYR